MGPIGFNELLILVFILIVLIIIPVIFIYKYGKQKGRLKELERQMQKGGNTTEV
jgi:heme/copper-type cytochrome/quinol oxidase subunit 2